jgi:integrase
MSIRVSVKACGQRRFRRFPAGTSASVIDTWKRDTRDKLKTAHATARDLAASIEDTLAGDALTYLDSIRALPTWRERVRDIQLWVDELGHLPRAQITSTDIRRIRDQWLTVGPRLVRRWNSGKAYHERIAGPLAASTVNHRLRALSNLWTVLDGRRAPNPVRDVPEAEEEMPPPRSLPPELVRAIIDAMPDYGRPVKGVEGVGPSKSKARIRVIAALGLPHRELARVRPEHIDWQRRTLLVQRRRKGKGAPARLVPLTDAAIEALRALGAADAYGAFSAAALHGSFRRACITVETRMRAAGQEVTLRGLRPYDLRHSYGADLYLATGDLAAVGQLMGHLDPSTTLRYARAAVPPRLTSAMAALEEHRRKCATECATEQNTEENTHS